MILIFSLLWTVTWLANNTYIVYKQLYNSFQYTLLSYFHNSFQLLSSYLLPNLFSPIKLVSRALLILGNLCDCKGYKSRWSMEILQHTYLFLMERIRINGWLKWRYYFVHKMFLIWWKHMSKLYPKMQLQHRGKLTRKTTKDIAMLYFSFIKVLTLTCLRNFLAKLVLKQHMTRLKDTLVVIPKSIKLSYKHWGGCFNCYK